MDFGRSGNRSWRSRESVKEREKEGEGEYQLLLECRSNTRQRGRGRCVCVCVCVFVNVCAEVSGFYAPFESLLRDVSSTVLAT